MQGFRFIFTLAGVLVVSCFVGTRDAYGQTKDDGGGIVVVIPPPRVEVILPPLGTDDEQNRRHYKANILNNWLNRNGLVAIPNGGGVRIIWDHFDGSGPLNEEQICCEIDLLMAALRRVLKNIGTKDGEDDTSGSKLFLVNVPGAPRPVRILLLLGNGRSGKAVAGGRTGDIVIVGGARRGKERSAQDAEANTGAGGDSISQGGDAPDLDKDENGNSLPSTSGQADNGGDATSTAGKGGTTAACGGAGGHGGTDVDGKGGGGGNSGAATATTTDKGEGGVDPSSPGTANAVAGRAGDGGEGSNGRDGGPAGSGQRASASVAGAPVGSQANARGGDSGNGGSVKQDVPDNDGNFGREGKTGAGGDGVTSEADKQRANGGNTGSGRDADKAQVGKGTATPSKDETDKNDVRGNKGSHLQQGTKDHCKDVVTDANINALIGN